MQSYKDLLVWQKSILLVSEVYKITATFPKSENFGLTSQMQRAAVSIPANIAEGYRRGHRPEYVQFLRIAYGSGAELETYFVLVLDLNLSKKQEIQKAENLLEEVMKMLNAIISSLR